MSEGEYFTLTSVQQQVLVAIGAGQTVSAAARSAGVHRNTINYWLRVNHAFQSGLEQVHHDQALHRREQAELLAPKAFENLRAVLDDPKTSPATRVRVSLAIIKMASKPLSLFPSMPEIFPETADLCPRPPGPPSEAGQADQALEQAERAARRAECLAAQRKSENLHKVAQISTGAPAAARPQPIRVGPKTGRNDRCPCGSGRKFKHCCLNKTPELGASPQHSPLSYANDASL